VGYDYFKTLGYTMLGGREFDPRRARTSAAGPPSGKPINVVIDASLAEDRLLAARVGGGAGRVFPSNAQRAFNSVAQPLHIIGVVANKPLRFNGAGAKSNMFFMTPGLQNQLVQIPRATSPAASRRSTRCGSGCAEDLGSRKFMDQLYDENYRNFARVNQVSGRSRSWRSPISIVGLFKHGRAGREPPAPRDRRAQVRGRARAPDRRDVAVAVREAVLVANVIAWLFAYYARRNT